MKKFVVTLFFMWGLNFTTTAQVTDTLQWLRTNIEQREHLFIHKPLKVMLDSLYELKGGVIQYFSPETISWTMPDTIWTNDIALYFGEPWGGGEVSQLHDSIPDINTHVPVIIVEFS